MRTTRGWLGPRSMPALIAAATLTLGLTSAALAQATSSGAAAAASTSATAATAPATPPDVAAPADPTAPTEPVLIIKKKKKPRPADAQAAAGAPAAGDAAMPGKKSVRKAVAVGDAAAPPAPGSKCKTRSFLVNDYGKDGPTADAKRLLDQDIADWSKANNLTIVKIGTKTVECTQFLNFVVFDEWTCTASAKVCWQ